MANRYCCFIPCDKDAVYEIDWYEAGKPSHETYTDSCREHLVEMLHGCGTWWTVYQIESEVGANGKR